MALLSLWTAIFHPNSNVLLLSKGQKEAEDLLAKTKFLFMQLPPHLRPKIDHQNKTEITFGFDYDQEMKAYKATSTIQALPATEDSGRSQTATLVIADENAFHPFAEKNFIAIQPTIDKGSARFIAVSTADGTGNFFATQYKLAQQGKGIFKRIFLSYKLRPGRDEEWYAKTQLAHAANPTGFFQEYPRNEEEAFIASGGCIFDTQMLMEFDREVKDSMRPEFFVYKPKINRHMIENGLRIWQPYNPAHTYTQWVDPATAVHGTDRTAFYVFDVTSREFVAAYAGKQDENLIAEMADDVGRYYGFAYYGIERNGVGMSILNVAINLLRYPRDRFYFHRDTLKRGDEQAKAPSPGWPATPTGNAMMQHMGRIAVANRDVRIYDEELIAEMRTFVEDPESHKVGAKPPDHDDRVRAFLGCLYLASLPEANRGRIKLVQPPIPPSRLAKRRRVMSV